jgi:hypothetical protein
MIRIYTLLVALGAIAALILLVGCSSMGGASESLPPGTAGPVTLSVDSTSHSTSDTIVVTLNNQSKQTIYYFDHQTNCTVIQLQQQVNGKWETMSNCGLGRVSVLHQLNAGQQMTVTLDAPHGHWPTGTYRAALSYSTSKQSRPTTFIYSEGFQIA